MEKKTMTLLLTMLTLCVCTVLVVGGTFALFTDSSTVNNHLSAGNLDIGLTRVSYKAHALDATGVLVDTENTDPVDLVANPDALFNIVDAVPTSCYQATIKVSNLGSTAFDYGVRILWQPTDSADDKDEILAKQIEITISGAQLTNDVVFTLDQNATATKGIPLGYLLSGKDSFETFTVQAKFVDDDAENNKAMLATLKFDVQVYATQKVSA